MEHGNCGFIIDRKLIPNKHQKDSLSILHQRSDLTINFGDVFSIYNLGLVSHITGIINSFGSNDNPEIIKQITRERTLFYLICIEYH